MPTISPDQAAHLRNLLTAPTVASQLPWRFANGASWTELAAHCSKCRQTIPSERFTGHLRPHSATMVMLDAVAWCETCNLMQGCQYRIFDDLHREGMYGGRWMSWQAHRTTGVRAWCRRWWNRVKAFNT